jgi:hypothetical protein
MTANVPSQNAYEILGVPRGGDPRAAELAARCRRDGQSGAR